MNPAEGFTINPLVVRTEAERRRWRDWLKASEAAGDRGEFVTDAFTRADYPGTDEGWDALVGYDAQLKALQAAARKHRPPEQATLPEPPATRVPAFCLLADGTPRRLADLEPSDATEQAGVWVASWHAPAKTRKGLMIGGPTGSGKTSLAAAIAVECGEPNTASFWSMRDFLAAVKDDINAGPAVTLERAARKPLLVLDDLGVERTTEHTVDVVRQLLERRYDGGLPTVVTTNLRPEQLSAHVGPRVWSRLAEMTEPLMVVGADRRLAS